MIQRIQTLYLILTILFTVLFLSGNMIVIENDAGILHQGIILPLALIAGLICILSVVTIFLYRKRKQQIYLAISLIVLSALLSAALVTYGIILSGKFGGRIQINLSIVLPFLTLIAAILAYRGIRKDEERVRSYDRLR